MSEFRNSYLMGPIDNFSLVTGSVTTQRPMRSSVITCTWHQKQWINASKLTVATSRDYF